MCPLSQDTFTHKAYWETRVCEKAKPFVPMCQIRGYPVSRHSHGKKRFPLADTRCARNFPKPRNAEKKKKKKKVLRLYPRIESIKGCRNIFVWEKGKRGRLDFFWFEKFHRKVQHVQPIFKSYIFRTLVSCISNSLK